MSFFRAAALATRSSAKVVPPRPALRLQPPASRQFTTSRFKQQRFGYEYRGRPQQGGGLWTRDRAIVATVGTAGVGGVYYVYHLEKVPETGRRRFMDVSPAAEQQMAVQGFQEVMSQYSSQLLSPRHPLSIYVQHVAGRIVSAAGLGHVVAGGAGRLREDQQGSEGLFGGLPGVDYGGGGGGEGEVENAANDGSAGADAEWEVYVINDPKTRNAFVLPGRKIFVFTGILPVAGDADGLASVLGHEIAHQVARHSAERMSSMKVLLALGLLLEYGLGVDVGITRLGLTLLMQLPNSRTQESEADRIGLRLMSQACYDPREAANMWTRMEQEEKKTGFGFAGTDFVSTHPSSHKRIKAIEFWLPEALDIRAASPMCSNDLSSRFESFRESVRERLGGGSETEAEPDAGAQLQPVRRAPGGRPAPGEVDPRRKPVDEVDEKWAKW